MEAANTGQTGGMGKPTEDMDQARDSAALPEPWIVPPRVVWAIGLNYLDHIAETGREIPTTPTVFTKSPGSVIGNGELIVIPSHVTQPDYEGEVAVIIGRRAKDIAEAEATEVIAGVTCANDVSARDHQYLTSQWTWSKSFDTFCALGPRVAPVAEIDLADCAITTRLNGEVVQQSSTKHLVFGIPQLVAELSRGVTLERGDVILTGTPAGVGAARNPPRFLRDGDLVEVTVAGVGTLRNPVSFR